MRNRWLIRGFVATLLSTGACVALEGQGVPSNEGLQGSVERAMEGQAGAVIVARVRSGEILAVHGLDLAAQRLERPGSTVKPFVLMALLETGKLRANERLLCRRPLWIGGVRMDCSHPASVVNLDAEDAVAYSCNSYFAEAATRLSGEELVQALRRAGLDAPSGLAKDEASGRIEMPRNRAMLQLEALGDRGIEVTPLELLAAYRKLALEKRNGSVAEIDAPAFAGLEQSVAYGMAHAANVEGMSIAGKTGTAASRESARTHGFFVGYAPAEKPEIVVVVFLEQGNGGDAAATAGKVFIEFAKEKQAP
ncbi:MAG: penicillin-binding transpeptidase domain-containing protein [Candidatus Acidiferrum sp.]